MDHSLKRILLATERTEFDAGAERVAVDLAKHCAVPLAAVLPVLTNPEYETIAPQLVARAEAEAAEKVEALRLLAKAQSVELDIVVRRGEEPYREIVQEATERHSDILVIRPLGKRSFLASLLVGEMVSKVVRHAPCNVLFVPREARPWSRGVLCAVDTSPNASRVATAAAAVARECELPLTIVGVVAHDAPAARAEVEKTLAQAVALAAVAGAGAQTKSEVLVGKPFERILGAATSADADLIVVGRHGESNVVRTPFGGTTQKVVGLAKSSVLVVVAH
jgi:nucleotide-binding universal stress UspA family protein